MGLFSMSVGESYSDVSLYITKFEILPKFSCPLNTKVIDVSENAIVAHLYFDGRSYLEVENQSTRKTLILPLSNPGECRTNSCYIQFATDLGEKRHDNHLHLHLQTLKGVVVESITPYF